MVTLRGITWDHPRGYQPLAACSPVYAEQKGVAVTWERRSLQAFGDLSLDRLAERFDLLVIDHPHVGEAAGAGWLLPLDGMLDESVLAELAQQSAGPSHESYFYGDHQWALAIDAALQTAAYRPDLFAQALPASWTEALDLAGRLAAAGRWAALPLCPTDAICSFLTLTASLGSPAGRGETLVDREAGLAALDVLARLCARCHPGSLDWNPIQLLDHMSRHDDVVYCPLTFCYSNYARPGYAPRPVAFAGIPGTRGGLLGGAGIAVSAHSAEPRAAAACAAWLCSAHVQCGLYVEQGGQPGNRLAWEDAHANALTNGFFHSLGPAMAEAYVRPRHAGFVAFQEQAGRLIHGFLRDGGQAAACLERLETLYRTSLARRGEGE